MNKQIQIFLFYSSCLISCNGKLSGADSDKKFIGKYKQTSGIHYEILDLNENYTLTSKCSSRILEWKVFNEIVTCKSINDTLLFERARDVFLKENKFPAKQKFVLIKKRLFEIKESKKWRILLQQNFILKNNNNVALPKMEPSTNCHLASFKKSHETMMCYNL